MRLLLIEKQGQLSLMGRARKVDTKQNILISFSNTCKFVKLTCIKVQADFWSLPRKGRKYVSTIEYIVSRFSGELQGKNSLPVS